MRSMMTQPAKTKTKEELVELLNTEGVEAFNAYRREVGFNYLDLSGLNFSHRDLTGINLSNAYLNHSVFDHAYLADARLVFAEMKNCSCVEADFFMATLDEADLSHCNLRGANFASASLNETVMVGIEARQANFTEADLTEALITSAQLNDADLTGARLYGTNFSDSLMEWALLDNVHYNAETKWGNHHPEALPETLSEITHEDLSD